MRRLMVLKPSQGDRRKHVVQVAIRSPNFSERVSERLDAVGKRQAVFRLGVRHYSTGRFRAIRAAWKPSSTVSTTTQAEPVMKGWSWMPPSVRISTTGMCRYFAR